jgi:hypothetical protein
MDTPPRANLTREEPDAGIPLVRVCEGWGRQRPHLLGDDPMSGQAFVVLCETVDKKTGKRSAPELAYGLTSCTVDQADAKCAVGHNRKHWTFEAQHNITDWNYDEDRSHIHTGHRPANMSRLRRFAIGLIKANGKTCVARTMRQLCMNTRTLLDHLGMSRNAATPRAA